MHVAIFGSSLLSSYWNGAATYYRGLIAALSRHGWRTTFYEPDAFDRQRHRDIDPPEWADVVVYQPDVETVRSLCLQAAHADVIVKASGVGVLDDEILESILTLAPPDKLRLFWDVDAPATLAALARDERHPIRAALPELDAVMTYGGGPPVVAAYKRLGAELCVPVYNALDPSTHHKAAPDARFEADLAFLGNRLPDREQRVEDYFFSAARLLPQHRFLLGGAGWEYPRLPQNVQYVGHVSTRDHNSFNSTPLAVINIARESMAEVGFSPATRVFEAAGAGACIITDAWCGLDQFLEPDREVLVANDATDVARHLMTLSPERAQEIGARALARVLRDHTYDQRASLVVRHLEHLAAAKRSMVIA